MSSKSPNKEELFRLGLEAAKSGQKQAARVLFQQVLQQDRRDVRAMLWMAKLAQNLEEQEQWLDRVLKVDAKNKTALAQKTKLASRDVARRNKLLLRVGIAVYIVVVILASIIAMIVF